MWGKYSYISSYNFSTGHTKTLMAERENIFSNLKDVVGIMKPKLRFSAF